MEEGGDFIARLGKIHCAFHTSGLKILECIVETSKEMLRDRMCTHVKSSEDPLKDLLAGRPVVTSDTTDIFLHAEDKVGVKFVRGIMEKSNDKYCVCVSIDGPTTFTKNEFQNRRIQFMTCKSLCVNVTHHELVPKHTLEDAPFPFEKKSLPLILETDPVIQYFNWPPGSVVRIDRVFAGSEPVPYFRLISASS